MEDSGVVREHVRVQLEDATVLREHARVVREHVRVLDPARARGRSSTPESSIEHARVVDRGLGRGAFSRLRGQPLGKMKKPAPEMSMSSTMTASDELTTARVVAQPTPSDPPKVERPECPETTGMAAP